MRQTTSKDGQMISGAAVKEPRDSRRRSAAAVRECALTRRERPISDLIRFVAGPGDKIYIDLNKKLPGRGVWITADRASIAAAAKYSAFSRSLKRKVSVSPDLSGQVEKQLRQRLRESLSLANKAGLLVTGFDKVSNAIERGDASIVLHGSDAAQGGRQKLDAKLYALNRAGVGSGSVIDCLTIDELSLAMGRPNVVHAALIAGGATDRFAVEADRLARFVTGLDADERPNEGDGSLDRQPDGATSQGEAPS